MLASPDSETADVTNNTKLLVKIIDFGLAKAIHTQTDPKSLTHDRFVGTPAFASPEQFEHAALDVRSDIYSLGETLWFALTGKTPFSGRTMEEIHRAQKSNVLPIEQLKAAHVPSGLRSLLESMLAFEPASRPGSHELAARLHLCSEKRSFFPELKRRNVYRAAVAYGVVAWFLTQLTTQIFPFFEIPNSAVRFVVIALAVGFPIAMLLSWLYEFTPEGVVRTEDLDAVQARSAQRATGRILDFIIIGVLLLVIAMLIVGRRPFDRQTGESISQKSIAVLPFQNLSADPENAFFTDGVQDEILSDLAKVADLKVISRTSAMQYKTGVKRNLREIANELGVAHVVEGSVQRAANRVRVSVQLIDARNDTHVWVEKYDRDLADVFAIQSEIAQKIANQLQTKLSPAEKSQMARKPTENGEAYLAFVQAHNLFGALEDPEKLKQSEQLYERAIELDPKFALAFAGLSMVESWIYYHFESTPARREKARLNADESLRLQPNLPEGHLALGFSYCYGDRDYERALAEFEIAKRDLPNEAQVYLAIGAIQRRQGKWTESTANLERAAALDPKNAGIFVNLTSSYMAVRNFEAADKNIDRAIAVAPQSVATLVQKVYLAVASKGDLTGAEKLISSLPAGVDPDGTVTWIRFWLFTLQRKFAEALAVVEKFPNETLATPGTTVVAPKAFFEGTIYLLQGDKEKAQPALEQARRFSEQLLRQAPEDPAIHAHHGLILAALGQKKEAIAEGKRAVELLPESQDAFDGPQSTISLAQIYAWTAESDEAFRLLDHLLTVPGGLTVPILKLDPVWDPLRSDPRFQKLCQEKQP